MRFPDPQKVDPLALHMPSRPRAVVEAAFVIAFVLSVSLASGLVIAAALIVVGVVLVRPWNAVHGSPARRVVTAVLLVPALVVPVLLERAHDVSGRRIGVQLEQASLLPSDPVREGGVAKIVAVVPGSPGAGRLLVGDRIVALAGRPLATADPVADVVARVGTEDVPVDTSVDVLRGGALVSVPLHVPWPKSRSAASGAKAIQAFVGAHIFASLAIRGICVIALVILLARADGQRVRQLGLLRAGALREIAMGLPAMFGAFGANLIVAIPIGLVSLVAGDALQRDMNSRAEGLSVLTAQGTGMGAFFTFAITAVFAAAFEELVFRGFLVPRLRSVTGSWVAAVVLANVAFASGHLYEGVAALFQTFAIGVYFSLLLLWRGRLESAIFGHASFNIAMFAVITALEKSGALEALRHAKP